MCDREGNLVQAIHRTAYLGQRLVLWISHLQNAMPDENLAPRFVELAQSDVVGVATQPQDEVYIVGEDAVLPFVRRENN